MRLQSQKQLPPNEERIETLEKRDRCDLKL
jgi:hypothetical protein